MTLSRQTSLLGSICLLLYLLLAACKQEPTPLPEIQVNNTVVSGFDLQEIRERGKLVALTDNSSTSYFIYKGRPMGFEYDLLQRLAQSLDVELEIVVVQDIDGIFEDLNNKLGDVVAANITVTKDRSKLVDFTEHHLFTPQVLVQRKPDSYRKLKPHQIDKKVIRNPLDLAGKVVHVRKNSSFYTRLQHLSDEIGAHIQIEEVPGDVETEQLIEMVAKGEIEYTIADHNVARLSQIYYPNLDIRTKVSFPQRIAWAVRKDSPELKTAIDSWILENRGSSEYVTIYNKYFRSRKAHKRRVLSDYSSLSGGKISEYDDLIRQYSQQVGWDWRLLASLIYQESHFDPQARSWTGATGLMQVLPETAQMYKVDSTLLLDPQKNILAGVRLIERLTEYWSEHLTDSLEVPKFVLASYNVGLGHIIDARRLAEKYEADPNIWENNVAVYLKQKSLPKFYNDPVVKYGYCRGAEPFAYVKEVLQRYELYATSISL